MKLPGATPTTNPEALTLAMVAALLLHVPPGVTSLRPIVAPWHTALLPVMAAGAGFMSTVRALEQPEDNVNTISALPALIPVTVPDASTIALGDSVDHVPALILLSVVVVPGQTTAVPVMAAGCALTANGIVVTQPVDSL